ncbi:MAG TPA: hypothetical protein VMW33_15035 [Ilumatobacteraceae bacterium]|nr:hypothetical protein [Ilumatobacteraceae bacterium]
MPRSLPSAAKTSHVDIACASASNCAVISVVSSLDSVSWPVYWLAFAA